MLLFARFSVANIHSRGLKVFPRPVALDESRLVDLDEVSGSSWVGGRSNKFEVESRYCTLLARWLVLLYNADDLD